jgi:hypothetical protein
MFNLRRRTMASVAVTLLSLPLMSVAQAGQDGKQTPPAHRAIYNTTRDFPAVNRPTPPLDGTFHMELTWPQGSPDFHGSN